MKRIFRFLTEKEEVALLQKGGVSRFAPEAVIVREGDGHGAIYVVRKGEVRVEKGSMGFPLELARLGPGEIFGEMSFIDGSPASANIVADDFVECFVIDQMLMKPLLKSYPSIYGRFYQSLAAILAVRLRETSALVNADESEIPSWTPEMDRR